MWGKTGEERVWLAMERGVQAKYKVLNNCDPGDKTASKLSRGENKIHLLC